ncbi:acylneuraminate cytidylyltransferase family protein [Olleya aquimaris]|nr:acylneuraminate cytidylyltransferase family protein [Olleya aquimaris]
MKTIAIIPARGNSKRLPEKNIKLLGGMPLLVHSIKYAKQFDFIDAVYVSTDCDTIKAIALAHGVKVIDRPEHLAGDFEPTVSALKHVLGAVNTKVDIVVLLQATNPLRPKLLLQDAFTVFNQVKADSLFTVSQNHLKFGTIKNEQFKPYNYKPGQRSQDLEPLFYENGLLYITKASCILNDEIITKDAYPLVIDHPFAKVDIDTQDDFDYAAFMLNHYNNE